MQIAYVEQKALRELMRLTDLIGELPQTGQCAISRYGMYLHDIRAFNTTIQNFLNHYLRHLKRYSADSCAAAMHDFFSDPRAVQKLIVNPFSFGGDCYTIGAMRRYLERNLGTLSLDRESMQQIRRSQRLYHLLLCL